MSEFDDFRTAVIDGAGELARTLLKGSIKAARADAEAFVTKSATKLKKWTRLLAEGELSRDEFETLVRSQKDLAELNALTQAGVSAIKVTKFRNELTGLVVKTAFDVIL